MSMDIILDVVIVGNGGLEHEVCNQSCWYYYLGYRPNSACATTPLTSEPIEEASLQSDDVT